MFRKQVLISLQITIAVGVLAVLWIYPPSWGFIRPPEDPSMPSRLAFAAHWLSLPGLSLLAGIACVACLRFFVADAIDGSETSESRVLQTTLRYNRNTLEQTVLVVILWPLLALALPYERLPLIPELSLLFVVGRALFWIGYMIAPWARAVGFPLTFYPTVIGYVWLILHAI